jgi:hypothetical protein
MRELAERVAAIGNRLIGYAGSVVVGTSDDPEYLTDNPNRRCPVIDKARRSSATHPRSSGRRPRACAALVPRRAGGVHEGVDRRDRVRRAGLRRLPRTSGTT